MKTKDLQKLLPKIKWPLPKKVEKIVDNPNLINQPVKRRGTRPASDTG